MRVVFLGYQTWGVRSLRALLDDRDHTVGLVITHPDGDDPYEQVWTESVGEIARVAGIETLELEQAGLADVGEAVRRSGAEIGVASDWRSKVDDDVIALLSRGVVNVHDGLLPRYGGFAPLNWAISRGEPEVGLTAHMMVAALDLGDIVVQERLPVGPDETIREVVERVFERIGPVTLAALARLGRPGFAPTPQDPLQSTIFHRRSARDAMIDWTRPARTIHNLVRAQADPYPNAYFVHGGRRVAVKRTRLPPRAYCGTPGRVMTRLAGGVVVVCGPEAGDDRGQNQGLVVMRVQPDGLDEVDATTYFTEMGADLL